MVIGHRFVWGHLAKTGGDAVRAMFALFPELVATADDPGYLRKHDTFRERGLDVTGKLLVLNIRRLPAWRISRAHEAALHGNTEFLRRGPAYWVHRPGPDRLLEKWTDDGRLEIGKWLRTEQLAEDFLSFVAGFTEVPEDLRRRVLAVPVLRRDYDHDLSQWFTEDQIRLMYENNPRWAELETRIYGDILELTRPGGMRR